MNINDTKQILTILKVNYPQSFKDWGNEQTKMYTSLWAESFANDDVNLVVNAIKHIINTDTREFAPNIAQVREVMNKLVNPNQLDEHEAWSIVKKALSRSGWYAEEEFKKLPIELQIYVGSADNLHEWSQMDSDELNTIVASNFMRNFRVRAKAIKEQQMLPENLKDGIALLVNKTKDHK